MSQRVKEPTSRRKGKPGIAKTSPHRPIAPSPRLSGSPARETKAGRVVSRRIEPKLLTPGPGAWVVLYLHSPREKQFGCLLQMDGAGVWIRGIELGAFEDWAREVASGGVGHLGLSTLFVPYLRVEKVILDERTGPVPSMAERFQSIAGKSLEDHMNEGAGSR